MDTISRELQELFNEVDKQNKGKRFSEAEILSDIQKYRKKNESLNKKRFREKLALIGSSISSFPFC